MARMSGDPFGQYWALTQFLGLAPPSAWPVYSTTGLSPRTPETCVNGTRQVSFSSYYLRASICKVAIFSRPCSYCYVRVQLNPFVLKGTGVTKTCDGKTIGVEE